MTRTHFTYLTPKAILYIIILTAISLSILQQVSALIITEVELNPEGGKYGAEWIEFYNEDSQEINISGWMIYDGLSSPKKIFTIPNDTFVEQDSYYIIELTSSRLNNDGDFVMLYDLLNNLIDETPILNDTKINNKTWQFCDGKWEFKEQTKHAENNCEEPEELPPEEQKEKQNETQEKEEESQENESEQLSEEKEEQEQNKTIKKSGDKTENKRIVLTSKVAEDSKLTFMKKSEKTGLIFVSIITLTSALAVLYFLKKI